MQPFWSVNVCAGADREHRRYQYRRAAPARPRGVSVLAEYLSFGDSRKRMKTSPVLVVDPAVTWPTSGSGSGAFVVVIVVEMLSA